MAADPAHVPKAEVVQVCQVCDLFLDWSQRHHEAATYAATGDFLQDFCATFGRCWRRTSSRCTSHRWLDAHPVGRGVGATPSSPSNGRSTGRRRGRVPAQPDPGREETGPAPPRPHPEPDERAEITRRREGRPPSASSSSQ